MIINASARTDIPAYFSEWFFNRLKDGYVYVRNPYYPMQVTKYNLTPDVVDSIIFCTKNPRPMLSRLNELQAFHPYFFVTITPYGHEVEPNVPPIQEVINDFIILSKKLGRDCVSFRYDPIFLNTEYTIEKHIQTFNEITKQLHGYTHECVISFIDLYAKTQKNFPGIQEVSVEKQRYLVKVFSKIAKEREIHIRTCAESVDFSEFGVTHEGCITPFILKKITGYDMKEQKVQPMRPMCHCYPSRDIGEYNTCMHGCLYCYANEDKEMVRQKYLNHDPLSPFLIGYQKKEDVIKQAKQESCKVRQLSLELE